MIAMDCGGNENGCQQRESKISRVNSSAQQLACRYIQDQLEIHGAGDFECRPDGPESCRVVDLNLESGPYAFVRNSYFGKT